MNIWQNEKEGWRRGAEKGKRKMELKGKSDENRMSPNLKENKGCREYRGWGIKTLKKNQSAVCCTCTAPSQSVASPHHRPGLMRHKSFWA